MKIILACLGAVAVALSASAAPEPTAAEKAAVFKAAGFKAKGDKFVRCEDDETASYMAGFIEWQDLNGDDVDEAAEVDGAGSWGRFWHVTLPLIKPVLAVVILFSMIFTFSDFNIVQVLTRGGPINTTHLFATLAYQVGLNGGNLGQGAAISLFIFPMLAAVVFVQLRYVRKD